MDPLERNDNPYDAPWTLERDHEAQYPGTQGFCNEILTSANGWVLAHVNADLPAELRGVRTLLAAAPDLHALCTELLPMVEDMAAEQLGYGFFPGGDPRLFIPDEQCATEEEIANHQAACEAMERGEAVDQSPAGETLRSESGEYLGHITFSKFGLGTYRYQDPEAVALLGKIRGVLAKANGEVQR